MYEIVKYVGIVKTRELSLNIGDRETNDSPTRKRSYARSFDDGEAEPFDTVPDVPHT